MLKNDHYTYQVTRIEGTVNMSVCALGFQA